MKKLLALSIALLSLNLYGAEKNYSKHGLEGWGKKEGVAIVVEDYSHIDKTFNVKAIKNQVELKLRLAGIKVVQAFPHDHIYINIMPTLVGERVIGYNIRVKAQRTMTFKYNGKEYIAVACSKGNYVFGSPINYRPVLDESLDQLLLNYLKANPKK